MKGLLHPVKKSGRKEQLHFGWLSDTSDKIRGKKIV
jgi:hypothetical protein